MIEDLFSLDVLDEVEFYTYLASEYSEIRLHRDILGDGYIELDETRDLD